MPLALRRLDSIDEGSSEDSSSDSDSQHDILALLRKKHNVRPRSASGASRPPPSSREKQSLGRNDGDGTSGRKGPSDDHGGRAIASNSSRLSSQSPPSQIPTTHAQTANQAQRPSGRDESRRHDLVSSSLKEVVEKQLPTLHEVVSKTREELQDLAEELRTNGTANAQAIEAIREQIEGVAEGQRTANGDVEDLLRKEREQLDALRAKLLLEQDDLSKAQRSLEQDKALFEQRKLACQDDIDFAERMMSGAKEAEARVRLEMQRLSELSQYCKRKDTEADAKQAEATELFERIQRERAMLQREKEEHIMQVEENREAKTALIKERIALLKTAGVSRRGKESPTLLLSGLML